MSGMRKSRLAALVAIVPVAAIGVVACGGSDSGSGSGSSGAAATRPSSA